MKKLPIIITAAVLLCCLVVACILLFPNTPIDSVSPENTESTVYVENAPALYEEAVKNLPAGDLQLRVKEIRTVTQQGIPYEGTRNYTIQLDRSDPGDQRYYLKDEVQMGSHSYTWEDYRIQDKEYILISGLALEDVTLRSMALTYYGINDPAAKLDATLYGTITATETEGGYHLQFSDADTHEHWLHNKPETIEYIRATAEISGDKQLLSYTYATAWQQDRVRLDISYEVTIEPMDITITLPEPEDGWLPLSSDQVYAPFYLESTTGILVQVPQVTAAYHEDIYFEALGDRRVRDITLELQNQASLTARFTTQTTMTNDSRADQPEVTHKQERFSDGRYTLSQNGSEEAYDPGVDENAMLRYLQNQLISTIMLPQYIADCQVQTVGDTLRYTFTGNAAFADFLCRNAGQQLYNDPQLLSSETVTIDTDHLTCYLEIGKDSYLPLAAGISFAGSYEVEGIPYRFSYDVSQTYHIG